MKQRILILFLLASGIVFAQNKWAGKRVAVLGDSISDSCHVGTTRCWWEMISDSLGLSTVCYAKNGWTIEGMQKQASTMLAEQNETGKKVDLILLFGGTNDFNGNVPMGEYFEVKKDSCSRDGKTKQLLHRTLNKDNSTFCGRVNNLLAFLKDNFPEARIVMLTPIHRAYAQFGATNQQPDEMWANELGLFLDDYNSALERASHIWAVPLLDLNVKCELYPLSPAYDKYVNRKDTDRLHPNTLGHNHMARAVQSYLESNYPW